jgi:hypothetical protein
MSPCEEVRGVQDACGSFGLRFAHIVTCREKMTGGKKARHVENGILTSISLEPIFEFSLDTIDWLESQSQWRHFVPYRNARADDLSVTGGMRNGEPR